MPKLLVVATPIGNLGDLSPRMREALSSCDLIAAEDTRMAMKLLNHFGIKKPLVSCHRHNEEQRAVELINRFAGKNALDARAEGIDLLTDPLPEGRFPLALLLKLLPLLGDAGYALLEKVDAECVCVSFPTRTLSGRDVGMERHYGRGFSENCPDRFEILDRFVHRSELIYILKER